MGIWQGPSITLAEMTVIVAREEFAKKVREQPPGSNRGDRIDVYVREGGGLDPEGQHYKYCTSFVCYCIKEAARRLGMTPQFALPAASVQKLRDHNKHLKIDVPEIGCVWQKFDEATQKGHTGLVVQPDLAEGLLYTIEANTGPGPDVPEKDREGDGVWTRIRKISEATAGFWRIA